jgi:hypothetical protein
MRMPSQTSYSIYVRFRGRRLALMKHIRSLDNARAALRTLREARFHDADQVFLINDRTKEVVDDAEHQPSPPTGVQHEPAATSGLGGENEPAPSPDTGAERNREAGEGKDHERDTQDRSPSIAAREVARHAPRPETSPEAQPQERPGPGGLDEAHGGGSTPLVPGGQIEGPPVVRLRRAMVASRSARARHDAAIEAVLGLRPKGVIDEAELSRLEASARAAAALSARALAQLEEVIARLDRSSS